MELADGGSEPWGGILAKGDEERKRICSSRSGRDALWFLSDVDDQSGWTIGRGESARNDVFYIPAILSSGRWRWRCQQRMSMMCGTEEQKKL